MSAPLPPNETERLQALHNYDILDTPPEVAFERLINMAARLFDVPIALITFVDANRQWFKACIGVEMRESPRELSFCAYAILSDQVMVVPDALLDPRFITHALVTGESHIRFYAGAPLKTPDGQNLGSICIVDTVAREFDDNQQELLTDLASIVVDELELRRTRRELQQAQAELEKVRELERARKAHLHATTHDLRSNLSILTGTTELISDERVTGSDRDKMRKGLMNGIGSFHQMLDELMDMECYESGHDPRRIAPFDAGQLLEELCTNSQAYAAERGLYLKSEGPTHHTIQGDFVKTRRIAQNILFNALKYTQEGGVTVTWRQDEDRLLLRVHDTGPGLGERGSSTTDQPHGEGLGLSIVARLCESLDARMQVESRISKGTTFQITFPQQYANSKPELNGKRTDLA